MNGKNEWCLRGCHFIYYVGFIDNNSEDVDLIWVRSLCLKKKQNKTFIKKFDQTLTGGMYLKKKTLNLVFIYLLILTVKIN